MIDNVHSNYCIITVLNAGNTFVDAVARGSAEGFVCCIAALKMKRGVEVVIDSCSLTETQQSLRFSSPRHKPAYHGSSVVRDSLGRICAFLIRFRRSEIAKNGQKYFYDGRHQRKN